MNGFILQVTIDLSDLFEKKVNDTPSGYCIKLIENYLPIYCYSAGGVELLTRQGKIKVDNTLEARLNMVAHNNLPQMRTDLFGANTNRKFKD